MNERAKWIKEVGGEYMESWIPDTIAEQWELEIANLQHQNKMLETQLAEAKAVIENSFPPENGFRDWDSGEWWQRRDALLAETADAPEVSDESSKS